MDAGKTGKLISEKSKERHMEAVLLIFGIVVLLFVMFKYETPVKYSENIVTIHVPIDLGIDMHINLSNYKRTNAALVKLDDDTYDLYINITQTLGTKLFDESDKTSHLTRVGNGLVADFHSHRILEWLPEGKDSEIIEHIYYMNSSFNNMDDKELINDKNKILIWERGK